MIEELLVYTGLGLIALGAFAQLVSGIGVNRFRNFYLRLHAATIGSIWGCVYPIAGAGLVALGYKELGPYSTFMAGAAFVTSFLVLILSPAGSHALARAAHKTRQALVEPCVHDALDPSMCVRGGGS
ncbi:monovalent cation/H(+) antiporter subunit G [Thermogladius sp. KZ2Tp1]|uniref:monovalent cation/H(+) antiporter subunit G n=1 Tax=unclassified Thermogladius TaxID=2647734 RepID=UPI003D0EC5BD